jgi:hypothetical protein
LKRILAFILVGALGIAATPSFAAENAQQERMKTCNKEAGDMKGDDRKKFVSTCLSDKKKASDNRMAACNTKSKGMKGDDRKKFMSECMKAA